MVNYLAIGCIYCLNWGAHPPALMMAEVYLGNKAVAGRYYEYYNRVKAGPI